MNTIKQINKLYKEMIGKPMTPKQELLLQHLRDKVKNKELTVEQAREMWEKWVIK